MIKAILRNSVYLGLGQAVNGVLYFLTTTLIARYFGVEKFGIFSFAEAVFLFLSLTVIFGTDVIGAREISKAEEKGKKIIVDSVIPIRFIFSLISFLVLVIFMFFSWYSLEVKLMVVLCGSAVFSLVFFLDWFFWGEERFILYGASLVIRDLFFLFGILIILYFKIKFLWIGVIFIVSKWIPCIFLLSRYIRKINFSPLRFKNILNSYLFGSAFMMFVTNLVGWIVGYFDIFLLAIVVGEQATGLYSAAYKPVSLILLAVMVYIKAIFPSLSKSSKKTISNFHKTVVFMLFGVVASFVPLMVSGFLFGRDIIVLIYGKDYTASSQILPFLVIASFIISINTVYSRSLVAVGKDRINLTANLWVGVLNISFNLFLIPFIGVLGAACSKIMGDGLIFLYYHKNLVKSIKIKLFKIFYIPVISLFGSIAILYFLRINSSYLQLILGAFFYFVLLGCLIFVSPSARKFLVAEVI